MSPHVMSVTEVSLKLTKSQPPGILVTAKGLVPTMGWSRIQLKPRMYIVPPADGIQEFDFIGMPPEKPSGQQITPVSAVGTLYPMPRWLNGVKVIAANNSMNDYILTSNLESQVNGSGYIGKGKIRRGVEGGCYLFVEGGGCIEGRSFVITPSQIMPEKVLDELAGKTDVFGSNVTVSVIGEVYKEPTICMQGEGYLVVFEYTVNDHSKEVIKSSTKGGISFTDITSPEILKDEQDKFASPCSYAKFLAVINQRVQVLLTKWIVKGFPLGKIECIPLITPEPWPHTPPDYRIVFNFKCPPGKICIWTPKVWVEVDIDLARVFDAHVGDPPQHDFPASSDWMKSKGYIKNSIASGIEKVLENDFGPIPLRNNMPVFEWQAIEYWIDQKVSSLFILGSILVPNKYYKARLVKTGIVKTNPPKIQLKVEVYIDEPVLITKEQAHGQAHVPIPIFYSEVPSLGPYSDAIVELPGAAEPITVKVR